MSIFDRRSGVSVSVAREKHLDKDAHRKQLLLEAIHSSDSMACVYDEDDCLIAWNPAYRRAHLKSFELHAAQIEAGQFTYEDLIRCSLRHELPEDEVEEAVRNRVERHLKADGKPVDRFYPGLGWYRITKRRTPSGAVAGFSINVDQLKETEASLVTANARIEAESRSKSKFLARLSHEIRTPMNGILGLAHALSKDGLTSEQRRLVELILKSGTLLVEQLNDTLDLGKVESGKIDPKRVSFSPRGLCADVADLFRASASEKRIVMEVAVSEEIEADYLGDEARIRQILSNLIGNAVKFTPSGQVTVGVEPVDDGRLAFFVSDTGPGIDEAEAAGIFEEYAQLDSAGSSAAGTGLGLTICRELAVWMGGEIDLISIKGEGATFRVTLPLEPASERRQSPATEDTERDVMGAVKILAADDNEVNRFVLSAFFEQLEVELTLVENGAEAVAAFSENSYDLVLLDQHMPVMDGVTACLEMRRIERERGTGPHRIYSLSADTIPEHVEKVLAAGADGHLSKPIDFDQLRGLIWP
ncbi:MAG: ATP-binding protein [Pseudomonadota bacterium]